MPTELRTIVRFYNAEQRKMYYPGQLLIVQSPEYAFQLIRKGTCVPVSIMPGAPMVSQSTIPVSGMATQEPVIETKQVTPIRRAKRK